MFHFFTACTTSCHDAFYQFFMIYRRYCFGGDDKQPPDNAQIYLVTGHANEFQYLSVNHKFIVSNRKLY